MCDSGAGEEQSSLRSLGQAGGLASCSQPVTQALRRGPVSETTGVLTAIPQSPGQCLSPWSPSPFPPSLLPIFDVIRLVSSAAFWNFSMAKSSFFTHILAFFLSMKSFPQLNYISSTSFSVSILWVLFVFISCVIGIWKHNFLLKQPLLDTYQLPSTISYKCGSREHPVYLFWSKYRVYL